MHFLFRKCIIGYKKFCKNWIHRVYYSTILYIKEMLHFLLLLLSKLIEYYKLRKGSQGELILISYLSEIAYYGA